jgi:excisionase family DNA binding protein
MPDPTQIDGLTREQLLALVVDALARLMVPTASATPVQADPGPRLLKVPEVAAALRVTVGHVYELIRQGELAAVRFGKCIVVREATLLEFIDQHEKRGPLACQPANMVQLAAVKRRMK